MIEIRGVPPQDYPSIKGLCDATFDHTARLSPDVPARKPVTSEQLERWGDVSYRRKAVLEGKIIAFFYLAPPPDKKPRIVRLEALATDPDTPYETQREAAYRLIRAAFDDYTKAGTEIAVGTGLMGGLTHLILVDLGLPIIDGAINPQTRKPIEYRVEVPLTLVGELLKKQGI